MQNGSDYKIKICSFSALKMLVGSRLEHLQGLDRQDTKTEKNIKRQNIYFLDKTSKVQACVLTDTKWEVYYDWQGAFS